MVLIQILLPASVSGMSQADISTAIGTTHRELAAKFEGLTAYLRSPARGVWTAPDGHVEQDDVLMVEVVTGEFERAWWGDFTARVASRFQQEAIHVRALPVFTLDE